MGKKITMQDIADAARVSKSAVSFAYNTPDRLSSETVEHIFSVAKELGYVRNPVAYMLRTQKTNSLGLLLPQQLGRVLENPYHSEFIQGIGQICEREGLTLLLVPPLRNSMLKAIPYAAVDGFIVTGLEEDRGEVEALMQQGKPFVIVDSEVHSQAPSINIDETRAMKELTEHLISLGHRNFVVISPESGNDDGYLSWHGTIRRRIDGVISALEENGIAPLVDKKNVIEVPCTRAGGKEAFAQITKQNNSAFPTAFICFSDVIAFGVMDAARQFGLQIPRDISVTGFDDLDESACSNPPLTTVKQPVTTKGRLAAEYIVETLNAGYERASSRHVCLPITVLLRESIGPAASIRE